MSKNGQNDLCSDVQMASYFTQLRRDVLAHIPSDVRRVLSVGCGAGATEAKLIERGVQVVGIEMNAEAAELARANGIEVIVGDAAAACPQLSEEFDCLVYADVLEHMVDPVAVLRAHAGMLRAGGTVVVSVPNFRNYRVLWQLFRRGHIHYADAGILDRTHVRITTGRMVKEWFSETGIRTVAVEHVMSQRREKWIAACSGGLMKDFMARQVIVVGNKV
jgi:methionine biosynthesis protein MetW